MKTIAILLLALVISPLPAHADENRPAAPVPVTLRYTFIPGERLRIVAKDYETDQQETPAVGIQSPKPDLLDYYKPHKQDETRKESGYDWTVSGRDAGGNYIVTVSYAYLRIEQISGKVVRPDSGNISGHQVMDPGRMVVIDTRQSLMAGNPAMSVLKAIPADKMPKDLAKSLAGLEFCRDMLKRVLVGRPFQIVVSPLGRVVEVTGMDEIMDRYREEMGKVKTDLAERAHLDELIESFFGEDNVSRTMTMALMLPYPDHAVIPGDTWSDGYQLELAGMKVPMKRTLRLDDYPDADGAVRISGLLEMDFPKGKNNALFETSRQSATICAVVDSGTGMFRTIDVSGGLDVTVFDRKAAEPRQPIGHMKTTFGEFSRTTMISRPDPASASSTRYMGADGTFRLSLESSWAQTETNNRFYEQIVNTYKQQGTGAELMVAVAPASVEKEMHEPLEDAPENMKADMSGQGEVAIVWSKLFETPWVRWVRYRMDITGTDGQAKHSWIQTGYGANHDYSILMTCNGKLAEGTDAEMTAILDGVAVNDSAPSDPFGE